MKPWKAIANITKWCPGGSGEKEQLHLPAAVQSPAGHNPLPLSHLLSAFLYNDSEKQRSILYCDFFLESHRQKKKLGKKVFSQRIPWIRGEDPFRIQPRPLQYLFLFQWLPTTSADYHPRRKAQLADTQCSTSSHSFPPWAGERFTILPSFHLAKRTLISLSTATQTLSQESRHALSG